MLLHNNDGGSVARFLESKWTRRVFLSIFLSALFITFTYRLARYIDHRRYSSGTVHWIDNDFYSDCFLHGEHPCYKGFDRSAILDSVDTLLVFRGIEKNTTMRRSDIYGYPIVMASSDRAFILRIISAMRIETGVICPMQGRGYPVYYFVFLDHTRERRGVIRCTPSTVNGITYGVLHSDLDVAGPTNRETYEIIQEIEAGLPEAVKASGG